jgi:hypothetical protein
LTPCDLFLFPKIKLKLKERRFDTIEEIQAESQRVLDTDRKGLPGSVPKMEEGVLRYGGGVLCVRTAVPIQSELVC